MPAQEQEAQEEYKATPRSSSTLAQGPQENTSKPERSSLLVGPAFGQALVCMTPWTAQARTRKTRSGEHPEETEARTGGSQEVEHDAAEKQAEDEMVKLTPKEVDQGAAERQPESGG